MRSWALVLLIAAACSADEGGTDYPIVPGGGGGTGGTFVPPGGLGPDASVNITGRVCLINDALNPTACASTGADNLTVALGTQTTTTMADGTFTIMRPPGFGHLWFVTGTAVKSSAMAYNLIDMEIPAIAAAEYAEMVSGELETDMPTSGAIFAVLKRAGNPVVGVDVVPEPAAQTLVYFDGDTTDPWQTIVTGARGIVWIPNMPVTTMASLNIDSKPEVANITTVAAHLTFVIANI